MSDMTGRNEHQRGPVLLRRAQIQAGTTDQRLLDSRGPSDWVHTDPWRVLRIQSEFVEGFGLLAEVILALGWWKLLARSTTIANPDSVRSVRAAPEDRALIGQGLADALNVGAY